MAYLNATYPTSAGQHPRIWIHETRGLSLATLRSRIEAGGVAASQWASMLSWCGATDDNGVVLRLSMSPASWLAQYEPEALAAMCLPYVLYPTNTTYRLYADKAISVAMYAAQSYPETGNVRDRLVLMGMAIVYDWLYDRLSISQRGTIRGSSLTGSVLSIVQRVNAHRAVREASDLSEFMWGHSSEWTNIALFGLCAILEDSSSGTENTTWRAWAESALDQLYNGTDAGGSAAAHKWFGDTDGGNFKGAGFYSYFTRTEEYYIRLVPALVTALNIDAWTAFPWWTLSMDWQLWHWRGDRKFGHIQNEGMRDGRVHTWSQIHALQVAARLDDTRARNAMWLVNEINNAEIDEESSRPAGAPKIPAYRMWGPYHIHNVLWRAARTATKPVATPTMKVFNNAKKIVMRDGFEPTSTSLTLSGQRYTGGHSRRDLGHIELATQGSPVFISHGHYTGNQTTTYNDPSLYTSATIAESSPTGHRFSYYCQSIAHNCIRITDWNEPADNRLESHQFQFGTDTYFGRKDPVDGETIDNQGGQLWPKHEPTGAVTVRRYQPDDLAQWKAEPKWYYETFATTPVETDRYCYAVIDCKPAYYAPKCARYKRHVLWIKANQASPTYAQPIIVVWDDVIHSVTSGNQSNTVRQQWGTSSAPSGTANNLVFVNDNARVWLKTLSPDPVRHEVVYGHADANNEYLYPPSKTTPNDDDTGRTVVRTELSAFALTNDRTFLTVLMPNTWETLEGNLPVVALFSDATHIGVTFADYELTVKIARGDTHAVVWGASGPPIPPPSPPVPPAALVASAGVEQVSLSWGANAETDLEHYNVYRQTKVGASYTAWAKIGESIPTTYTDTTVSNTATYRYAVTAVNTTDLESAASVPSLDMTPQAAPQAPSAPSQPVVTAGDDVVTLAWLPNIETDIDYYNVYRQHGSTGSWDSMALIGDSATATYTDSVVDNGTTYRYEITAVNTGTLESIPSLVSDEVTPSATPPPPPPPPGSGPSYNNLQRSVGMHMCLTIPPAPNGTPELGDRKQWCWLYSAVTLTPSVPDTIADGDAMDVSGTGIDGEIMDVDDIDTGNPIDDFAGAGVDGEEITT